MLDHILDAAQNFERIHGVAPDVIRINPYHYESLCRHHPGIFRPPNYVRLGFRLVIVPASVLAHPEAALLAAARLLGKVA